MSYAICLAFVVLWSLPLHAEPIKSLDPLMITVPEDMTLSQIAEVSQIPIEKIIERNDLGERTPRYHLKAGEKIILPLVPEWQADVVVRWLNKATNELARQRRFLERAKERARVDSATYRSDIHRIKLYAMLTCGVLVGILIPALLCIWVFRNHRQKYHQSIQIMREREAAAIHNLEIAHGTIAELRSRGVVSIMREKKVESGKK